MFHTKSLETDHKDVIHDIAFDYYGRRMATCSSDQVVKIWNLNTEGEWELNGTLQSHSGAVWKVTWAHPEFGQIIATCSFDRSATIYEETVSESGQGMQTSWLKRHTLVDVSSSVTDIKFAPKCMGLVLATCSADGLVRVYEATDVMNLSQWTALPDINTRLPSCSCISWNPSPSRMWAPLLAVGSDDECMGGNMGSSAHNSASTSPNSARVAVFSYSEVGSHWEKVETLSTATEPVYDLAFAPNPGRSFHTLAVASKDLRIIILKPKPTNSDGSCGGFELQLAGQFSDHGSNVWRVAWNLTGTVLTASGDNGLVKIYKANYLDVWKCVGTLSGSSVLPHAGDDEVNATASNATATTATATSPAVTYAAAASKSTKSAVAAAGVSGGAVGNNARFLKGPSSSNAGGLVAWH